MCACRSLFKWLLLLTLAGLLNACVGGSIAQQLATSMALQAADRITANAYAAQQRTLSSQPAAVMQDIPPDDHWATFIRAGFEPITPTAQPLPETARQQQGAPQAQAIPLVRIELWNLIVGEEKIHYLERAQLGGASNLPDRSEWHTWQLATGAMLSQPDKPLHFLIPPGFSKLASGEITVVEMADSGRLSILRYANNRRADSR